MASEPSAHGASAGSGRSAHVANSARVQAGPPKAATGGASLARLRDPSTAQRYLGGAHRARRPFVHWRPPRSSGRAAQQWRHRHRLYADTLGA